MAEGKKKKVGGFSLRSRIFLIALSCFLPLTALIGFLLYTQYATVRAFDQVATSVNYASRYVTEFKERMDYSIYYAIIWDKPISELREGIYSVGGVELVYPYDYIEEMRAACAEMSDIATVNSNQYLPRRIDNTLNSLEKIIEEIEDNMRAGGHYDENEELLDDVRNLTDLIQENIQNYINDENASFTAIKEEMMRNTNQTLRSSILIVAVVAVLTTFISNVTQRGVVQPVRKLCEASKLVAKGDFTVRSDVESRDEIAMLADNFNDMTVEIGRLVERIKEEQENIRIMESKLLQAQINPHFLFNTLNMIASTAQIEDAAATEKMITALSRLFRYNLKSAGAVMPLERELKIIQDYMYLQKMRFGQRVRYDTDCAPETLEVLVPSFVLQPLVENSIKHGLSKDSKGGRIFIRTWMHNGQLWISVADTGAGMEADRLKQIRAALNDGTENEIGIGVGNIYRRVRGMYEDGEMHIYSHKGCGTAVQLAFTPKDIASF